MKKITFQTHGETIIQLQYYAGIVNYLTKKSKLLKSYARIPSRFGVRVKFKQQSQKRTRKKYSQRVIGDISSKAEIRKDGDT